jgi:hypothetical protein
MRGTRVWTMDWVDAPREFNKEDNMRCRGLKMKYPESSHRSPICFVKPCTQCRDLMDINSKLLNHISCNPIVHRQVISTRHASLALKKSSVGCQELKSLHKFKKKKHAIPMKNYNRVLFTLRSCQCGYFLQALTRLSWLPEIPRHTEAQGSITLDD